MCFGKPFSIFRIFRNKAPDKDSAEADGIEIAIMSAEDTWHTDTPSPKKTAEEPPAYEYQQEELLDPSLIFSAKSLKRKRFSQKARDRAFAKSIVEFIAEKVEEENCTAPYKGGWGYSYGEGSKLEWDKKIGYLAVDAFKKGRISFIVDEAKLDLKRRGFVVKKLEVVLADEKCHSYKDVRVCKKSAAECTCWYHGIYVNWKICIAD